MFIINEHTLKKKYCTIFFVLVFVLVKYRLIYDNSPVAPMPALQLLHATILHDFMNSFFFIIYLLWGFSLNFQLDLHVDYLQANQERVTSYF